MIDIYCLPFFLVTWKYLYFVRLGRVTDGRHIIPTPCPLNQAKKPCLREKKNIYNRCTNSVNINTLPHIWFCNSLTWLVLCHYTTLQDAGVLFICRFCCDRLITTHLCSKHLTTDQFEHMAYFETFGSLNYGYLNLFRKNN